MIVAAATLCLLALAIGVSVHVASCTAGARETTPHVWRSAQPVAPLSAERTSLKVMTLNAAHGRGNGRHQAFRQRAAIESHLDDIAGVLKRERPDVIALQEADGPSAWSGRFDHVAYLAEKAGCACAVRGAHVDGMDLSYGTALLSTLPLRNPSAVTFAPSPPTFAKGFVVCTVDWPGTPGREVDIVSVHIDFSRKSVRRKQIEDVVTRLVGRGRPVIIMGDLNSRWEAGGSPVRMLAEKLGLKAYRPEADGLRTFATFNTRLDWILISPELEFATYEVLDDTVSDHFAVISELRLAQTKQ